MMRTLALVGAAVLVVGASTPLPAQADVLEADLDVSGMSCPFCAFGIEKKLRAVSGVDAVSVLLDEGRIELRFVPENDAAPADIRNAVKDAGFKLSGLRLKVQGTLAQDGGRPMLQSSQNVRFLLVDSTSGESISGERLERLQAAAGTGPLVVFGTVAGSGDGLPRLALPAPAPSD